jgi:hypothetical protein
MNSSMADHAHGLRTGPFGTPRRRLNLNLVSLKKRFDAEFTFWIALSASDFRELSKNVHSVRASERKYTPANDRSLSNYM